MTWSLVILWQISDALGGGQCRYDLPIGGDARLPQCPFVAEDQFASFAEQLYNVLEDKIGPKQPSLYGAQVLARIAHLTHVKKSHPICTYLAAAGAFVVRDYG